MRRLLVLTLALSLLGTPAGAGAATPKPGVFAGSLGVAVPRGGTAVVRAIEHGSGRLVEGAKAGRSGRFSLTLPPGAYAVASTIVSRTPSSPRGSTQPGTRTAHCPEGRMPPRSSPGIIRFPANETGRVTSDSVTMLRLVPSGDCMEAREAVSARLDGELTELDAVRLEGHLRACADCRDFAAEAGSAALLLREAPLEQPAVRIWAEPARPRRRLGLAGGMAAAAAVIVAAAAPSFLLGRTLGHQPEARTATGSASEPSRPTVDPALLALLRGQQNQGGRIIHV